MQKLIAISTLLLCFININFAQNATQAIPKLPLIWVKNLPQYLCKLPQQQLRTQNQWPQYCFAGGMSPRAIHSALSNGKMQAQGAALSDEERKAVAQWITKRPLVDYTMPKEAFTTFSLPPKVSYTSGWGGNLEGTGFSTQSNINPDNVASLKSNGFLPFPTLPRCAVNPQL
nr:hypothetical protein [Haliscomenobacter sp.]